MTINGKEIDCDGLNNLEEDLSEDEKDDEENKSTVKTTIGGKINLKNFNYRMEETRQLIKETLKTEKGAPSIIVKLVNAHEPVKVLKGMELQGDEN